MQSTLSGPIKLVHEPSEWDKRAFVQRQIRELQRWKVMKSNLLPFQMATSDSTAATETNSTMDNKLSALQSIAQSYHNLPNETSHQEHVSSRDLEMDESKSQDFELHPVKPLDEYNPEPIHVPEPAMRMSISAFQAPAVNEHETIVELPARILPIHVFVHTKTGNDIRVEVEVTDTIGSIKRKFSTVSSSTKRKLMFAGKILDDDSTVADYNLQKGSTLLLIDSNDDRDPQPSSKEVTSQPDETVSGAGVESPAIKIGEKQVPSNVPAQVSTEITPSPRIQKPKESDAKATALSPSQRKFSKGPRPKPLSARQKQLLSWKQSLQPAAAAATPRASEDAPATPHNADDGSGLCLVCQDARADFVIWPCGHMCLCEADSIKFQPNQSGDAKLNLCPVCRGEVKGVMKVFFSV